MVRSSRMILPLLLVLPAIGLSQVSFEPDTLGGTLPWMANSVYLVNTDDDDARDTLKPDRTVANRDTSNFHIGQTMPSEEEAAAAPRDFTIASVSPNPFNPSTTVTLTLPHPGHLTVEVFDVLGRHVATLIDAERTARQQTLFFDGRDLASGIYLVRAVLDGRESVAQKLVLLK